VIETSQPRLMKTVFSMRAVAGGLLGAGLIKRVDYSKVRTPSFAHYPVAKISEFFCSKLFTTG
jgi:hypothetical protein